MTYQQQPMPTLPGTQYVGYVFNQARGITQPEIFKDGLLGITDRIWLTVVRVKTLIIVGTFLFTLLSMILVAVSGKKESFVAGGMNVLDEVRAAAGQKLKSALYL